MKPALLVIDVQNAFMPYMAEDDRKIAPLMINWAIDSFRRRGLPIFAIYHSDLATGPAAGTEAFSYDPSILIGANDAQIVKNFPNSFKSTELRERLQEVGCDTLFLCGLSATGCVIATYFGAKDLGYQTILLREALLSRNAGQTDSIESIFDTINLNTLQVMLDSAQTAGK
jgi:nicotinamidase-related amidase